MTKYFHVSLQKPLEGETRNLGGVATFAGYLQRAVPEMQLVSWYDYPYKEQQRGLDLSEFQAAQVMNEWLLRDGIITSDDIVVCDGYWGHGLEGKVKRLVSVCHGSYYGRFIQAQINPCDQLVMAQDMLNQIDFWDGEVEIVCVCNAARDELLKAGYDLDGLNVIYNGVPLDQYYPELPEPRVWMHAADYSLKGLEIVAELSKTYPLEHFGDMTGNPDSKRGRLNQAIAFLSPSRYEGNSYMLLEAMACGVPLIAHAIGAAREMDARCGMITDDLAVENFARLMSKFDRANHNPRDWVQEFGDYKVFEQKWRTYLEVH